MLGVLEVQSDLGCDDEYVNDQITAIAELVERARCEGGTVDVTEHGSHDGSLDFLRLIMKLGVSGEDGTAHGALEDLLLCGCEVGMTLVDLLPDGEDRFAEHHYLVILKRCFC